MTEKTAMTFMSRAKRALLLIPLTLGALALQPAFADEIVVQAPPPPVVVVRPAYPVPVYYGHPYYAPRPYYAPYHYGYGYGYHHYWGGGWRRY